MFDYLNSILFKTKDFDSSGVEESKEFQPFLVQRWCSMYSPQISDLINCTSNRVWPILDNKKVWLEYLQVVIPVCKFKRINYIKKKKDTSESSSKKINIQKVANRLEISSREVSQYIELYNLQIPDEKKSTNQT